MSKRGTDIEGNLIIWQMVTILKIKRLKVNLVMLKMKLLPIMASDLLVAIGLIMPTRQINIKMV